MPPSALNRYSAERRRRYRSLSRAARDAGAGPQVRTKNGKRVVKIESARLHRTGGSASVGDVLGSGMVGQLIGDAHRQHQVAVGGADTAIWAVARSDQVGDMRRDDHRNGRGRHGQGSLRAAGIHARNMGRNKPISIVPPMFYITLMSKRLTPNQLLGEIGEAAARKRFLSIGFQFDARSRLEAGIDGIAEVMENGRPMARMIAVQVKARKSGRYSSEDDHGFTYLLRAKDVEYWRGSNLPVIIVLYRECDETYYWQEVPSGLSLGERRLRFSKEDDALDSNAVDRLAALTVPKTGFGYYVPPLGGGEEALVNILPITLPSELFVASTPYSGNKATSVLLEGDEPARFDWVIHGGSFWSFHDPRTSTCRDIVDLDQVEAIETDYLALHEDLDERNEFAFLLKCTLRHQVREDLNWSKDRRLLYCRAIHANQTRTFYYESSKRRTSANVVNVVKSKKEDDRVEFVRHHAFVPRFEVLGDQWFLVVTPTYYFTTDGLTPHSYPHALLSGKKRMDNSASLRGQVIMWYRLLTKTERDADDLFNTQVTPEPRLTFGQPPQVFLETRVPEDVWGSPKQKAPEATKQKELAI